MATTKRVTPHHHQYVNINRHPERNMSFDIDILIFILYDAKRRSSVVVVYAHGSKKAAALKT